MAVCGANILQILNAKSSIRASSERERLSLSVSSLSCERHQDGCRPTTPVITKTSHFGDFVFDVKRSFNAGELAWNDVKLGVINSLLMTHIDAAARNQLMSLRATVFF